MVSYLILCQEQTDLYFFMRAFIYLFYKFLCTLTFNVRVLMDFTTRRISGQPTKEYYRSHLMISFMTTFNIFGDENNIDILIYIKRQHLTSSLDLIIYGILSCTMQYQKISIYKDMASFLGYVGKQKSKVQNNRHAQVNNVINLLHFNILI